MDRAITYAPENLRAGVKDFYSQIFDGPEDELKKKLKRVVLALSTAMTIGPGAAFAEDGVTPIPAGNVTFTTFLNAVKAHQIEKVNIVDGGK